MPFLKTFIFKFNFRFSNLRKAKPKLPFFDIAANLADKSFSGYYYDKKTHDSDVDAVIERAQNEGCDRLLIVGGYIQDSIDSYELSKKNEKFYCTVGVHPCRVMEVEKFGDQAKYFVELDKLISSFGKKCVAVGECGLDYDRFEYATKEFQLKHFPPHFDLAEKYKLPMYLHNRNTNGDFANIVKQNRSRFPTGVVHSFTGDSRELKEVLELDLFVGINGCSLKTEENLKVLKEIPLDKIMLETDCPYCEIRASHAGYQFVKTKRQYKNKDSFKKGFMVRGRNEPCNIKQVSEVVAAVLGKTEQEIAEIAYSNTLKMFNLC